jgi:hypothetical protein
VRGWYRGGLAVVWQVGCTESTGVWASFHSATALFLFICLKKYRHNSHTNSRTHPEKSKEEALGYGLSWELLKAPQFWAGSWGLEALSACSLRLH